MARESNALLDRLDTTACVVTSVLPGGAPAGCLVTYVTPCSIHPARLLVLTSHENLTHEAIDASGVLAVHPLRLGQEEWVRRFGLLSGREADKFGGLEWTPGETGAPVLADALGALEGRVVASLPCGDHTARLVDPVAAVLRDADALPLRASRIFALGLQDPGARSLFPWRL